jgi:glutamate dehydrogenase (NADP+)
MCFLVLQDILERVRRRDPEQKEFLQAVEEVLTCLEPVLAKRPEYATVLERMCEPERLIVFRCVHSIPMYLPQQAR